MSSRFDYVKYDDVSIKDQECAKAKCQELEQIIELIPGPPSTASGRARALALTALEECYMWIGKAIRDEQLLRNKMSELQEGRTNS